MHLGLAHGVEAGEDKAEAETQQEDVDRLHGALLHSCGEEMKIEEVLQ